MQLGGERYQGDAVSPNTMANDRIQENPGGRNVVDPVPIFDVLSDPPYLHFRVCATGVG